MKKIVLLLTFISVFSVCFAKESQELPKKGRSQILETTDFHVLEVTKSGDIAIDVNNGIAKQKMKFDIFDSTGSVNMPVGRVIITHVTPKYSVGTLISRVDGYKPTITEIKTGMVCHKTSKATLKAEKQIYKNQKKAMKRQYKMAKIENKKVIREALSDTVKDVNNISEFKLDSEVEIKKQETKSN